MTAVSMARRVGRALVSGHSPEGLEVVHDGADPRRALAGLAQGIEHVVPLLPRERLVLHWSGQGRGDVVQVAADQGAPPGPATEVSQARFTLAKQFARCGLGCRQ